MTKRIVTLLLAALMLLGSVSLIACTQPAKTSEDAKTPSAPASDPATPSDATPNTPSQNTPSQNTPTPPPPTPSDDPSSETPTPQEPEPEYGTTDWVRWLVDVDGMNDVDPKYNRIIGGSWYPCGYGGDTEYKKTAAPWEYWPNDGNWGDLKHKDGSEPGDSARFHMTYKIDRSELDLSANVKTDEYAYIWQIWYKDTDADYSDLKVIQTAPWSVYNDPAWTDIIYRIPTWDDGMKDMKLEEGETAHEYEIIFVIYENEVSAENIVGWRQEWTDYTDGTQAYIDAALRDGAITE